MQIAKTLGARPGSVTWDVRYPIRELRGARLPQREERSAFTEQLSPHRPAAAQQQPRPMQSRMHRDGEAGASHWRGERSRSSTQDATTETAEHTNGREVGCHVLVRLWRFKQSGKPELETLKLAIQNAVLCSDMGLSISPCGKMLALCACPEVCLVLKDLSLLYSHLKTAFDQ